MITGAELFGLIMGVGVGFCALYVGIVLTINWLESGK